MRLSEVVNQAVSYVNSNLVTEPPDIRASMSRILNAYSSGQEVYSHGALLEPHKGRQRIIAATVEPYEVMLVHPNRASPEDIFIRTHKKFSKLRFREEEGWEIRPLELCIGLRDLDTWLKTAYVVAKDTLFAVSPPDRQTIDFDSNQGSLTNVVYVNRAYPNEILPVMRIAQKAIRSYRARQR
jgi:hypothetical protein